MTVTDDPRTAGAPTASDARGRDTAGDHGGPLGEDDVTPDVGEVGHRPFRARELLPVGLLGVILPVVLFGMWPIDRPVVYTQDAFQHLALARTADWTGTPGFTDALAAPHGLDWHSSLPTGTERIHVLLLRSFDAVTGDPFAALNLFVVAAICATVVVSYCVLRWVGGAPLVAAATAVVFAFGPPMSDRLASGHLFLFALYPVALGTYLVLWSTGRQRITGWRSLVLPGLAALVVATSSVYYATFTVVLLAIVGAVVAVRRGSWRSLVLPAAVVGVLVAAVVVTLAPDLVARAGAPVADGFNRSVQDSDRYGLRLAQMVMPLPDSRIPLLGAFGEKAYWVQGVGDYGANIGLLGAVGLVCTGWTCVRRAGRTRDLVDATVGRLAVVAGSSVLVATVGGLGLVLATVGATQTRVWSRMAAFVGFAALASLMLLAQRRWSARRSYRVWVIALVALALVEHPLPTARSEQQVTNGREDAAVVESLRADLPAGAQVMQLPVVPFPDDLGSDRLLAPSLHDDGSLRFSAGEFKGSDGDWQQGWMSGDVAEDTRAAALAGFDALLVQTSHHLVVDPDRTVDDLEAASGTTAWRSPGSSWAWVDLRPLRARLDAGLGSDAADVRAGITRPIGVTIADWRFANWAQSRAVQNLGPDGAIVLHPGTDDAGAEVSFVVGAPTDAAVTILAPGAETITVRPGPDGEAVTVRVPKLADPTSIRLRSDGPEERFTGATPASVWITDIRVRDLATADVVDAID